MAHNHGSKGSMAKEIAKGSVTSATVHAGGKIVKNISKHPLVVFGLGIVAGYVVYRYRKEIISGTGKAVGAGKDFVLHQKENLEDLVAESKEKE